MALVRILDKKLKLAFTGDVMLGRLVNYVLSLNNFSYVWGNVLPLLASSDLRLINLECVIAEGGKPWTKTPKAFHFKAYPYAIQVLKKACINYVSLANNHSLDYGEEALIEMLNLLDKNGISHAGAGKNLTMARKPAILKVKETIVAVLSFTDNEPEWEAGEDKPGVNYMPITLDEKYFSRIRESVREARKEADIVVFSIHWGPNMVQRPSKEFKEFAHAVIDTGVDIYHGHSAHLFQGIELYKEKVIMYDCGDFIDDYAVDPYLRNDESFLFLITLTKEKIEKVELFPVLISEMQVNLVKGKEFDSICNKMIRLCEELGTYVEKLEDRLLIKV
jgi:poly-gamma-glutamate synthesis protein (capsule biosynthesis protein)